MESAPGGREYLPQLFGRLFLVFTQSTTRYAGLRKAAGFSQFFWDTCTTRFADPLYMLNGVHFACAASEQVRCRWCPGQSLLVLPFSFTQPSKQATSREPCAGNRPDSVPTQHCPLYWGACVAVLHQQCPCCLQRKFRTPSGNGSGTGPRCTWSLFLFFLKSSISSITVSLEVHLSAGPHRRL